MRAMNDIHSAIFRSQNAVIGLLTVVLLAGLPLAVSADLPMGNLLGSGHFTWAGSTAR
jgi:hypothetical protein